MSPRSPKDAPDPTHAGRGVWGLYGRLVAWVCGRPTWALGVLLLALLPAVVLTAEYFADVRAGLQELLPRDAPSVRALDTLHAAVGGQANLVVIARSNDAVANRAFVTELATRLRERHIPQARSIRDSVRAERQWVQDHAALLLPAGRFDPLLADVERAVRRAKDAANPFFVDLETETVAESWARVETRLDHEAHTADRFPNGYLETADGHMVVLLIALEGSEVDIEPSAALLAAVQREVGALRGRYPRALEVAYNGEVPNLVEEHAAILADLGVSSVMVFVLVGALIIGYFRSVRALAVVLLALAPGLAFTFAIGRLSGGFLNSNTAFLGSIIAGNGINYPLLVLAYYRARPHGELPSRAIVAAARQALPGTLGAAATASAAYGGLASASFKGFSQFGWLGGVGMLTTWVFTFLTMPLAIILLSPPRKGERATSVQEYLARFFGRTAGAGLLAALVVLGTLFVGGIGVQRAMRGGFYDMDLTNLRNRASLHSGSASWDRRVAALFGVWLNPAVALVNTPAEREAVATTLRDGMTVGEGRSPPLAERVETIDQYAPDAAMQTARLVRLRALRADVDEVPRDQIPARARPYIDAWLAPANLQVITPEAVPEPLARPFTELSGRRDRVVLLFPSLGINFDDGRNVIRFADRLAALRLPRSAVVGGAFLFMAEIIRMVRDEAPRVVLVVCALVALALLPIFRRRPWRIPIVVATVATVALSAQAVMFAVGVRLNMLNFAAVPITIGVGADYVVNLLGAMDAFGVDARRACARMGGAILLCSLTTVVGYTSLLLAQSGALRAFGWAAVLGEAMAVTTVLLVLPVVMGTRVRPSPPPTTADPEVLPDSAS